MNVRNVVRAMNFHALIRVDNARKRVSQAQIYESELRSLIARIVNNRIFQQENVSLDLKNNHKELNVYIGSDLGFCANFNAAIKDAIRADQSKNDKILIGKKIHINADNVVYYTDGNEPQDDSDELYSIILDGVLRKKYSKINVVYIHYYNLAQQELLKQTILPFDYAKTNNNQDSSSMDDFIVEGDLSFIIWNLISLYVSTEIKIRRAWSWASENVGRKAFTDESLKKIDERDAEQRRLERKKQQSEEFKAIVEMNNRKIYLHDN